MATLILLAIAALVAEDGVNLTNHQYDYRKN